ncbi:MAG: type II toxin-antitoxin system VapC family toxin [Rhizomicrobium sp.]|jgi:ribonuclease VapC
MFVDASAIIAILAREPEADEFSDILEKADRRITSPIAVFEATLGLLRIRTTGVEQAARDVNDFLAIAGIECTDIASGDGAAAIAAFSKYGTGRDHPARLNMGDCFAYAVAKNRGMSLLFKGDDFARTDIRRAARVKR